MITSRLHGEMNAALARAHRIAGRFMATGKISPSPTPIFRKYFDGKPAFFVQVGSNDGKHGDPLHELIKLNPQWFGIFIEPVEYAFRSLVRNYGGEERFKFEQIAVAEKTGEREFYYVSEKAIRVPGIPDKHEQMGSFDRNHILKHSLALEPFIITQRVPCEPLMSVLDRNQVENVDILHIDIEGYDYHVLKQIDFARISPKLILYEHVHLKPDELSAAENLLSANDYSCANFGLDTMAIRRA